jgi:predicted RNA-binding Zn-ribbon protein involved in translation (DUF1610 family)
VSEPDANLLTYDDCPECGVENKLRCEDRPEDYEVVYTCETCGWTGDDSYLDLYGPMSVPWGGI